MKRDKYVGMDVHQPMTVVAVRNAEGKIVLETMVPTAAAGDGSAHSGTEDCDRCSDNLEKRRNVRLQETECDTLAVFESSAGGTGRADKTGNGADRG